MPHGRISHQLGEPRTAKEILARSPRTNGLRDSVERMLAASEGQRGRTSTSRSSRQASGWKWIPQTEQFTNNSAANEMLRRADRKPFVVPEIA